MALTDDPDDLCDKHVGTGITRSKFLCLFANLFTFLLGTKSTRIETGRPVAVDDSETNGLDREDFYDGKNIRLPNAEAKDEIQHNTFINFMQLLSNLKGSCQSLVSKLYIGILRFSNVIHHVKDTVISSAQNSVRHFGENEFMKCRMGIFTKMKWFKNFKLIWSRYTSGLHVIIYKNKNSKNKRNSYNKQFGGKLWMPLLLSIQLMMVLNVNGDFLITPRNIIISPDNNGLLQCLSNISAVDWRQNENKVWDGLTRTFRSEAMRYLSVDPRNGSNDLWINGSSEAAGIYICLQRSTNDLAVAASSVTVLVNHVCSQNETSQFITMTCTLQYAGEASPTVTWMQERRDSWTDVNATETTDHAGILSSTLRIRRDENWNSLHRLVVSFAVSEWKSVPDEERPNNVHVALNEPTWNHTFPASSKDESNLDQKKNSDKILHIVAPIVVPAAAVITIVVIVIAICWYKRIGFFKIKENDSWVRAQFLNGNKEAITFGQT